MNIIFEVKDETVQSYLDEHNAVNNTNLTVESLTPEQRQGMANQFGEIVQGEIEMRTDDHSGFETSDYWKGILPS